MLKINDRRLKMLQDNKEKSIELVTNGFSEQNRTFKDVLANLKKYGKCAMVRPTGFGKTWILTELIKHYKKVLYLYPAAVIRDTVVNRYYDSMFDSDEMNYIDEEGLDIDPDTIDMFIEARPRSL